MAGGPYDSRREGEPLLSQRSNLKRGIGLLHLVGIEIGQTIGAGIFALTGLAFAHTGPSLSLAFLAASVPVALAMAVLAQLASAEPVSGGTYWYGSRHFSPVLAFTGIWGYVLGAFLGMFPLYALTGASFLQAVFPALPRLPTAAALLLFFYAANLLGARLAVRLQAGMVAVLLAALGLFVGAGAGHLEAARFSPLFPGGAGGFAVAAALLTFTLLGANAAVELGDEIVEPARTIPRSFLLSIPLVTLLYAAIGLVMAGATPWSREAAVGLPDLAARILGRPGLLFFLLGGGFLAVATTLNSTFLWGTRSLLVVIEDGLLPGWLARVSPRSGTPQRLLTVAAAVSCLALLLGERVETFAVFASLGGIVIFLPVMGAALRLRRRPGHGERAAFRLEGPLGIIAPAAGLLLCLLIVAILLVDLATQRAGILFLALFAAWIAAGACWAGWRLRRRAAAALR